MNNRGTETPPHANFDRRALIAGIGGLAAGALLTKPTFGGSLTPPAGPVTPTGRSVQEIYDKIARTDAGLAEPRIPVQSLPGSATVIHVISEPGSYYLSGNLVGQSGRSGISVQASDVHLDLCGFDLNGVDGVLSGIESATGIERVVVENGRFVRWPDSINLGDNSIVRSVELVEQPFGTGISVRAYSIIDHCLADGLGNGVRIRAGGDGALVSNCVARGGDVAIQLSFGAHLENCVVGYSSNGVSALNAAQTIRNVRALRCLRGIHVDSATLVEGCHTFECEVGISVIGGRNHVQHNSIISSTTGMEILGENNLVRSNSLSLVMTPFSFAPGNAYGPIVDVTGVGDISSVVGAGHPWANFIH